MTVISLISELIQYSVKNHILEPEDRIQAANALYDLLDTTPGPDSGMNISAPCTGIADRDISAILDDILGYMAEAGILPDNTVTYRDLAAARVMGLLMPRQSEVIHRFWSDYEEAPEKATNAFYTLNRASNYIQVSRIAKNIYWRAATEFGDMEITVNLSKPEKDPREIAALKNARQTDYPKCLLCVENTGFAGNLTHPARQNLRLIPVTLNNEQWYFQYSPYLYYNEHCIVLNEKHIPMELSAATFRKLADFLRLFPHYFIGSNADLPIVGGSILTHDHFQGGRHRFPMEAASAHTFYTHTEFSRLKISLVNWPMSVIRVSGEEKEVVEFASFVLDSWRKYSDEASDILAFTAASGGALPEVFTPHNTVTPIARVNSEGMLEMDLVLRNNRTTPEHPMGIFHPHADLHHIKKENIGLIEVMGLAVLPGRLSAETAEMARFFTGGGHALLDAAGEEGHPLHIHYDWLKELNLKYPGEMTERQAAEMLQGEIGRVFVRVLSDAGVFKRDNAKGFGRFMESLGCAEI